MSDEAKALLHYASNANAGVADNESDRAFCEECARRWAACIIAGEYEVSA